MTLHHRLLDDRLLRYRDASGHAHNATLPDLFVAMTADTVRDFPALRPHQRHPWHAFLTQLAAIALHAAGRSEPFETADEWRAALLALTPDDDPDGAAFSLVAPDDRPAFLQAPCAPGESHTWKKAPLVTPDALDMLVTSRNHDVKAARMTNAQPEDWVYALVSLQTQEGVMGAGNYGISRMNGGLSSRPAFGAVPQGLWGKRWQRDTRRLLQHRQKIVDEIGLKGTNGIALVWTKPWDGVSSLSFSELDPFYIEVCRRVRLDLANGKLFALTTSSKTTRIAATDRKGATGDAWTPVAVVGGKALSITATGFDYKLMSKLAFEGDYKETITRNITREDGEKGIVLLAQAVARGQGKTEGYHERRIPISRNMRLAFLNGNIDELAYAAERRISVIGGMRTVLWGALCALFANGEDTASDDEKDKASRFAKSFEQAEDCRFFDDLIVEVDGNTSEERELAHEQWLGELADRAQQVLIRAFVAGPRASTRRYRAQSAALSRFRVGIHSKKEALQTMARVLKQRSQARKAAMETDMRGRAI
ncbi:CRISPR-associated protein Cse1 [Burkholderia sp. 8Y]|uniref:type I-E CRISPR-associated protein Cse1/CasA n=1 Tax=Burkholderia sp. 8Y TaxID=2653133 RepID=UPI0012EFBFFF|nr:type I-E CRISPR-associated protein Cse1/CasA [Burkholderia sp. 8Y]VXC89441.1 CRISPR-associated protein Cse1 [Burkholderia sp. 8Y]